MNSRQRRKLKRKWRYHVVLRNRSFVEFDKSITWAHEHFGYHKYRPSYDPTGCHYSMLFDDSKKALLFALVWSR